MKYVLIGVGAGLVAFHMIPGPTPHWADVFSGALGGFFIGMGVCFAIEDWVDSRVRQ